MNGNQLFRKQESKDNGRCCVVKIFRRMGVAVPILHFAIALIPAAESNIHIDG